MKGIRYIMLAGLSAISLGQLKAQDGTTMQTCEYWFDYGFDSRVSEPMSSGTFSRAFDVSDLSAGVHSIGIRFGDSKGLWAAPIVKHFVVPALPPETYDDNSIVGIDYWTDYDYARRKRVETTDGNVALALDVSALSAGVHSVAYSAIDGRGFHTAPTVRHFVVPSAAPLTFDDNEIKELRWWMDNDYAGARTEQMSGGVANLALDVSALSPGVHSFAYQVTDGRGFYTAPFVRHFVVPGEAPAIATGITAYEYWFNHGPRVRVDVDPQNPLDIKDMVIEIKDVVPNAITEDYRFDVTALTVVQPDDVTFGIQAFDDLGNGSQAATSESFPYDVTVDPAFVALTKGQPYDFTAPATGRMQGFSLATVEGDSVILCVTTGGRLDLYDEAGNRMETERTDNGLGQTVYSAVAGGTAAYALLWGTPVTAAEMQIEDVEAGTSGVESIVAGRGGLTLRAGRGTLTVETAAEGRLTVVSALGAVMIDERIATGTRSYGLQPGVYVVRLDGNTVSKIAVR